MNNSLLIAQADVLNNSELLLTLSDGRSLLITVDQALAAHFETFLERDEADPEWSPLQ